MKLKKKVPLIDQHDKYGFWGGKFGGSFIPETLKKPVEDLTKAAKPSVTDPVVDLKSNIQGVLPTPSYLTQPSTVKSPVHIAKSVL